MIVDTSLLLSQFAKKRNIPVKYDRNLVAATVKAMERVGRSDTEENVCSRNGGCPER